MTTIKVCALETDIKNWPAGDQTELGERGLNASGGQKARISLARAVYANTDILLLDDPLAAVDVRTCRILWYDLILNHLDKLGKTVLIATHATHLVASSSSSVDKVLVMNNGKLADFGSVSDVINRGNLRVHTSQNDEVNDEAEDVNNKSEDFTLDSKTKTFDESNTNVDKSIDTPKVENNVSIDVDEASKIKIPQQPKSLFEALQKPRGQIVVSTNKSDVQVIPELSIVFADSKKKNLVEKGHGNAFLGLKEKLVSKSTISEAASKAGKLVVAEEAGSGGVTFATLSRYVGAAGGGIFILSTLLFLLLVSRGIRTGSDYWISLWTTYSARGATVSQERLYLGIYAAIILGVFVSALAQGIAFAFVTYV
jgi:ABC-type sugar transport system ATPase subunit